MLLKLINNMKDSIINSVDSDGVKLITFNRPEARNAFNREMREALISELTKAREDDTIKAIILTGEGTSFSAGIDMGELTGIQEGATQSKTQDTTQNTSPDTSWSLLDDIRDFSKFIFMAVNGTGVGLGTTILGLADIVIAGKSARFKCPFTELGVGAEVSSTWLLPQLIGWQNAAWLIMSSEWVDADQAKEMGLVYKVVPDSELLEETMTMAKQVASRDLAALMGIKETMNSLRRDSVIAASKLEGQKFMELIEAKMKK